jgi:hypothetical protein
VSLSPGYYFHIKSMKTKFLSFVHLVVFAIIFSFVSSGLADDPCVLAQQYREMAAHYQAMADGPQGQFYAQAAQAYSMAAARYAAECAAGGTTKLSGLTGGAMNNKALQNIGNIGNIMGSVQVLKGLMGGAGPTKAPVTELNPPIGNLGETTPQPLQPDNSGQTGLPTDTTPNPPPTAPVLSSMSSLVPDATYVPVHPPTVPGPAATGGSPAAAPSTPPDASDTSASSGTQSQPNGSPNPDDNLGDNSTPGSASQLPGKNGDSPRGTDSSNPSAGNSDPGNDQPGNANVTKTVNANGETVTVEKYPGHQVTVTTPKNSTIPRLIEFDTIP